VHGYKVSNGLASWLVSFLVFILFGMRFFLIWRHVINILVGVGGALEG